MCQLKGGINCNQDTELWVKQIMLRCLSKKLLEEQKDVIYNGEFDPGSG